ncbi:hypothetical protein GCM10009661_78000 [Catellatospora chokoriensis]|uniref:GmrSD restriction endonucleases N-terminal domain-containing protein n=2 Tax=Catellatospora chokoriensis TaxID=310353 RepID=A0A8J3K5U4_9ACTN|nr:hypothetical protein Cch02nite_34630 [Catellatospora chokoriensis]
MYAMGELHISPDFQRLFRWSEGAQSRFIESLLLELPVPPIFLIEREDRIYELIDGLQRISSYLNFRGQLSLKDDDGSPLGPLTLSDCDIVPGLNGFTHHTLPRSLEIKLKRSYIRAEILRKESDPRLRYYMFKRLNTGGETLSEQEVRNATIRLMSNSFNEFIIRMSSDDNFKFCIATISPNQWKQRFDQELVLRLFALKNAFEEYRHDVANFLTDYMESVSGVEHMTAFSYEAEESVFAKTFALLRAIAEVSGIGEKIFGTTTRNGEPRGQFSVYHYEGLVLGVQSVIGSVDLENTELVARLAAVVRKGKGDPDFLRHTGGGKNSRIPLRERREYFASRFRAVLES